MLAQSSKRLGEELRDPPRGSTVYVGRIMKDIPRLGLCEIGIIDFQTLEYVLQAWWGRRWWTYREAEAVSLIDVVIRVLAENDNFDSVKGRML